MFIILFLKFLDGNRRYIKDGKKRCNLVEKDGKRIILFF